MSEKVCRIYLLQETLTRLSTAKESKESSSYSEVNYRWMNSPKSGEYRSDPVIMTHTYVTSSSPFHNCIDSLCCFFRRANHQL